MNTYQIVVVVAAFVSAIVLGIPAVGPFVRELQEKGPLLDLRDESGGIHTSRLLDLAFVLLCAVLFSLLLVDALLLSGRPVGDIFFSTLYTLIITATVTLSLLFMWYRDRAELGVAWWAVVTLALLVLEPGGEFAPKREPGTRDGINLWIPVLSLVFLAISMWVYVFGHPLDKAISRLRRTQVRLFMLLVVGLAVLALGQQYKNFVENDSRTPNTSSKNVDPLIKAATDWDVTQTRIFYMVASDAHLIDDYERLHSNIAAETEAPSGSEDERPSPLAMRLEQEGFLELPIAELVDELTRLVEADEDREEIERVLVEGYSIPQELAGELVTLAFTSTQLPELRVTRVARLLDYFENLSPQDQLNFLSKRLFWIHPTGVVGQNQPVIPLPGITPRERFDALDERRMMSALETLPNQRNALLWEFSYPENIETAFAEDVFGLRNFQPFGPFADLLDEDEEPELFQDLGSGSYVRRLQEQLSLPTAYEAYLAFAEYEIYARQLQAEEISRAGGGRPTEDKVQELLADYDSLGPDLRRSVDFYLIENEDREEREEHFDALVLLAHEDLAPNVTMLDQTEVRDLADYLDPRVRVTGEALAAQTAQEIRNRYDPDQIRIIRELLQKEEPAAPVANLLDQDVQALVVGIDQEMDRDQRNLLFGVIENPINIVMPELLEKSIIVEAEDSTVASIDQRFREESATVFSDLFAASDDDEQRNFLHVLALDLYQASGEYAIGAFSLIIAQATAWWEVAGLLVASFILAPFVMASAILGLYAARRLTARDRLRELVVSEASQRSRGQYALGMTDRVRGRTDIITQLVKLAGRGWSSIAVVGRRGVGKTRVLYELLRNGQDENRPTSITAWVSAPSKFEEAEFVESVFERITADIENAISICLGAKPLEVRRLENGAMLAGVAIYVVFVIIVALIFYLLWSAVRGQGQVVTTWFSILIVFALSGVALALHITRVQPVNLSSWLERDRSSNPHTVLLYREARRARAFLDARRNLNVNPSEQSTWLSLFKTSVTVTLGLAFVSSLLLLLLSGLDLFLLLFFLGSGLLLAAFVRLETKSNQVTRGYSLMSLVSTYRDFVERTVYRIRQGALGERQEDEFEIVVCIDELDKIVSADELRDFLRRMKVILEIPGAYYYLSLSEDALQALYLGAAEGKNEIDSTFDHIVSIPPVKCELGAEIAASYIQKNSQMELPGRVTRMVGAVSFGVPRDIVRRCDELLMQAEFPEVHATWISDDLRRRQAQLAFGEQLLSKQEQSAYSQEAEKAATAIKEFVDDELRSSRATPRTMQIVLSLWVLALLSLAATLADEEWEQFSETLRDIGYRIADEPAVNLIEELASLHRTIIEQVPADLLPVDEQ